MMAFHALAALLLTSLALADTGPFFRSPSYEQAAHGKWPHQSYHSSHILGPLLNIRQYDPSCDDGRFVLLSIIGSSVPASAPMILDNYGNLIWSMPSGDNWGLDVQMWHGEPHLTFCDWQGWGTRVICHMLDSSYQEVFSIHPQNGLGGDGTEFAITDDNSVILTTNKLIPYDLTPVNGHRKGFMRDVGFQELDPISGEILFSWNYADHYNITSSMVWPKGTEGAANHPWDPFHINSVQKDSSTGNYLISARHTSLVGLVSGQTGDFIWKLGGKENMFNKNLSPNDDDGYDDAAAMIAATNISFQHHARFLQHHHHHPHHDHSKNVTIITLFDNGVIPNSPIAHTNGKMISLDLDSMTARVLHSYASPHRIGSESRGSMQMLPDNGHVLLGYGVNPGWSEFSADTGSLLCDVHFGPESRFGAEEEDVLSYRVLKKEWVGRPKTKPSAVREGNEVFMSWNGATEVVGWGLVKDGKMVVEVEREGFETRISVPEDWTVRDLEGVHVVGLDAYGHVLGRSTELELEVMASGERWMAAVLHYSFALVLTAIGLPMNLRAVLYERLAI